MQYPKEGVSVAIIQHIVTDQGNGGAFCGNCDKLLSENPLTPLPGVCPGCGVDLMDTGNFWMSPGGSDF